MSSSLSRFWEQMSLDVNSSDKKVDSNGDLRDVRRE